MKMVPTSSNVVSWILGAALLALPACKQSSSNNNNGSGDMAGGQNGNHDLAGVVTMPGAGIFPSSSPFYQDISGAPLAADAKAIIDGVQKKGGWGNNNIFQIDFSIEVLGAADSVTREAFTPTDDFYDPDCDPAPVPLPAGGRLEGETGYECTNDGDCHLIVVQGKRLYEMWRANVSGTFYGGCLAVWDLSKNYWQPAAAPNFSRGDGCSSADAAGLPIAPLLFTADEVAAGEIKHAIRFILPNNRIRDKSYVHPGTHATGPPNGATGGADTPPYASRWRLKASFDESTLPSEGARVVARALKKYGMFLADGGNIALTGQADTYTTAKWDGLLAPRGLQALKVTDFEVVDGGEAFLWGSTNYDCSRTPITN